MSSAALIMAVGLFTALSSNVAFFKDAVSIYGSSPTGWMFVASLFAFIEILEKVLLGIYHGILIGQAVPTFGGGGFKGSLLVGIITAFALLPFFAFDELDRILGRGTLRDLLVKARATSPMS